jgi:hypothetical protein
MRSLLQPSLAPPGRTTLGMTIALLPRHAHAAIGIEQAAALAGGTGLAAPLLAPSRLRLDAPQSSPLAGVAQLPGLGAGRAPAWAGVLLDADGRALLLACVALPWPQARASPWHCHWRLKAPPPVPTPLHARAPARRGQPAHARRLAPGHRRHPHLRIDHGLHFTFAHLHVALRHAHLHFGRAQRLRAPAHRPY